MKILIKREWNYCKKEWIVQLFIELLVPLLVIYIYMLRKVDLFKIMSDIFVLPQEIYVFFGITPRTETGNIVFFILFSAMFVNVWIAWKSCRRTVQAVYRDERNKSIYILCNQLYCRKQLGMAKYLWAVFSSLGSYFFLCLVMIILIFAGAFNQQQRMEGMSTIFQMTLLGMFVLAMLVSLTFLYAVCSKKGIFNDHIGWLNLLVFGTLVAGNFYKVIDVAEWLIEYTGKRIDCIEKISALLEKLYWVSPLSWLNPFAENSIKIVFGQIGICLIFSGFSLGIGLKKYYNRNFVGKDF